MKVEEAALQLEQIYGVVSEEIKRALDVADDALGKQLAKKPVYEYSVYEECSMYCNCPSCGSELKFSVHRNYCPECGQKLKWEVEE